jgi:hypothetical protein
MRKLTEQQWNDLNNVWMQLPDLSDSYSASGAHYLLSAVLRKLGFAPNSREEAIRLAERLLSNGYTA